jgi:cytochrome c-type biogenesis protein CcmH
MSILFWSLATVMSLAAISVVAIPLKVSKLTAGRTVNLALVALPLSAFALYSLIGSPSEVSAAASPAYGADTNGRALPSSNQAAASVGSVASLVDGLSARLQEDPDDAGGWLLLARSYEHLGRNDDAIAAYARAQSLGKSDAAFAASLPGAAIAAAPGTGVSGPASRGRDESLANE